VVDLSSDEDVLGDLRMIVKDDGYNPKSPQDICNKIFCTAYMASSNSSLETRARAKRLSEAIGSFHLDIDIDTIIAAFLTVFSIVTGKIPSFGGSKVENLALQNVQARVRMVVAYLFAQLIMWTRGVMGSLLVLGSANVDET
jgi:NAD+ synthase (glutamine-hydrolysing)